MNKNWRDDKGSICDFDVGDIMLINGMAPTSTVLDEHVCEEDAAALLMLLFPPSVFCMLDTVHKLQYAMRLQGFKSSMCVCVCLQEAARRLCLGP